MAISCTSCEASTSSEETSQVFKILPRIGMMAWKFLSRACFAEPPAESPSTINSSDSSKVCPTQSANLPGKAGPDTIFFRSTFFAAFKRRPALAITISANCIAMSEFWFNHKAKASLAIFSTIPDASRLDKRSLVWPENCGSWNFNDRIKFTPSQTSSAESFMLRGNKLRNSQNSRIASVTPERNPLTWVPPCAVGIKLT